MAEQILEHEYSEDDQGYCGYDEYLYSLSRQLNILRDINAMIDETRRIPDEWFDGFDTTSEHVQTLRDLEFIFVNLDTVETTFQYNLELLRIIQPLVVVDSRNLYSQFLNTDISVKRNRGLHRLRIDLLFRAPNYSWSMEDLAIRTQLNNLRLCGPEILGALSVQDPELVRSMDGKKIPFFYMPGIICGENGGFSPKIRYEDQYRNPPEVFIRASRRSDKLDERYSTPLMLSESGDRKSYSLGI